MVESERENYSLLKSRVLTKNIFTIMSYLAVNINNNIFYINDNGVVETVMRTVAFVSRNLLISTLARKVC